MINELQRQAYLSALGIENYMPRLILPLAPRSVVCELPTPCDESVTQSPQATALSELQNTPLSFDVTKTAVESAPANLVASDILSDVAQLKKPIGPINAASILEQLEGKKQPAVAPFALSLWRPVPGFLIVDSRNTGLALPTELLLNNLLRCYLPATKPDLREEVMRWPMIENRFVSRTADDARNELQTWLAVENELRPISRLWLMGENASRYLLAKDVSPCDVYWQAQSISLANNGTTSLEALVLPSLVELLQQPLLKSRLWKRVN